jgi:alpha-L-rhamnosidase
MRAYLDEHLTPAAQDHIVDSALADHLSPSSTDGIGLVGAAGANRLVSTAYYAQFTREAAGIADLLGETADAERYRRLHDEIRDAFNRTFFDEENDVYLEEPGAEVLQTAQVVPLAFGLVPEDRRAAVAATAAADVASHGGNLDTGIVGTRYLLHELTKAGLQDVAVGIVQQRDKPSWGEWLELGYTSLPENWGATIRSLDHHMFGSVGGWLYEDVAGIEPLRPGFAEIDVTPGVPSRGLDAASARIDTVRGEAASSWRRTARAFELDVTVPPGAQALVRIPAAAPEDVKESGVPAAGSEGVEVVGREGDRVVLRVGSGRYAFEAPR